MTYRLIIETYNHGITLDSKDIMSIKLECEAKDLPSLLACLKISAPSHSHNDPDGSGEIAEVMGSVKPKMDHRIVKLYNLKQLICCVQGGRKVDVISYVQVLADLSLEDALDFVDSVWAL